MPMEKASKQPNRLVMRSAMAMMRPLLDRGFLHILLGRGFLHILLDWSYLILLDWSYLILLYGLLGRLSIRH
jgi:hypothetical protein